MKKSISCSYWILCLFFFTLFFIPSTSYAVVPELIFFEDEPLYFEQPLLPLNNDLYVPLRSFSQVLDLPIHYDQLTKKATVHLPTHTFSYCLQTQMTLLDNTPIFQDTPPFLLNNQIFVPASAFASLAGLRTTFNTELFSIVPSGEEVIHLDYLEDPLTITLYDYLPIHSLLINQPITPSSYLTYDFNATLIDYFQEDGCTYLTFIPFTYVSYPDSYATLGHPFLFNFSDIPISLPLSSDFTYTYLTYEPDVFSSSLTYDSSLLLNHLDTYTPFLATLNTYHGEILSVSEIYIP